jgi:hypothetical protein
MVSSGVKECNFMSFEGVVFFLADLEAVLFAVDII